MSLLFEISDDDKEVLQKTILQANFKQEKVKINFITFCDTSACIDLWSVLYQKN